MTTATVRDLRYDFPAILKRLNKGEEIAITKRGKLVGKLVPAEPTAPKTVKWPDIVKRLEAVHGKRVPRPGRGPVDFIIRERQDER